MPHLTSILRDALVGDCSNHGATAPERAPRGTALVVVPGCETLAPAGLLNLGGAILALVPGNLPGTLKAVPLDADGRPRTFGMFGGAYITSSDSRWRVALVTVFQRSLLDAGYPADEVSKIADGARYALGPVPVHDRFE